MFALVVFGGVEPAVADPIYSFTTIVVPGVVNSVIPSGINDSGQIVGHFEDMHQVHHSFLDSGGVFTFIDVPGAVNTDAGGINDSGQIVGTFQVPFQGALASHGFLDIGGRFTIIDVPGALYTLVDGINDSGQIVGLFFDARGGRHGFVDTYGSFTIFDFPVTWGPALSISGINDSDQIVGTFQDSRVGEYHGFLDIGGSFTTIDAPGASRTFLAGINNLGQIVGDSYPSGAFFLDTNGSFTAIEVPGVGLTFVSGINDSGQIVGITNAGSGTDFFVGTPVATPEPQSIVTLATCLVALFGIAWHRRRGSDGRRPLA
jgi:uncharacterized membrane protein